MCLPSGEKLTPSSASGVLVSCLTLNWLARCEIGMIGVVGFQKINVLVAAAVGEKDDLLAVGRPGEAVIVGGLSVSRLALPPLAPDQENLAVDDEGDVFLVVRQGELGGIRREGDDLVWVGLVVGVGPRWRACGSCRRGG